MAMPVLVLEPLLRHVVRSAARTRPEMFERLGHCQAKRYLIDPTNLPIVFTLKPDSARPRLQAWRRSKAPACDARIAGSFLTLLDMVEGKIDGDALFFARKLVLEGDTEAIVTLRNALDDLDGCITDDLFAALGPLSGPARTGLEFLRKIRDKQNER